MPFFIIIIFSLLLFGCSNFTAFQKKPENHCVESNGKVVKERFSIYCNFKEGGREEAWRYYLEDKLLPKG